MTEEEKIELANSEWARSQATPHSVGPAEAAAGLMIAPKAAATWGTGKVLEAGLNLIAPDAEDTLLEQAISVKSPLIKTGIKGTRLLYDKILTDVFDQRVQKADPVYAATDGINKYDQTELKLEPFQSNTYQRSVISKMNKYGMGDGTFRMNAYRAYLNKGDSGRDMLESYLSPDRLKGSFQGYKKFNKKSVEYKWGAFLEKKGYDLSQGIQVLT